MLGAMTGAVVKIIVITDISFAASLPLAISRTMARDKTIAAAAPNPCTRRAVSMSSIFVATAATIAATVNRLMPTYSTGRRPMRSETSPAGIWPSAMPAMKTPTISCPIERFVSRASTIDGTAGRLRSTVSAATAVMRPSVMTKPCVRAGAALIDGYFRWTLASGAE